jgi:F0F1-type ATP synthase membrane subunit c/vacuolar-type H+-ATPase subunit K
LCFKRKGERLAWLSLEEQGIEGNGFGAAIGVGLVGMKGAEAVGRNPYASTPIMVQSIIGMALAEAVAFYSLFL